jgi:hypothetical protein
VTEGRWLTYQQLLKLHHQWFTEGGRAVVQMLRVTADQYDEALMPHPTLNQIANQIEAILNERNSSYG